MINKIKLVNCPDYVGDSSFLSEYTQKILPLGIAQLTAYLRDRGFVVNQDDLNIKVYYDNYNKKDFVDLSLTENKERIINFLKNGNDIELEKLTQSIVRKTNFEGYDMIGISVNYQDGFFPLFIALLIAKYLKKRYDVPIVLGGTIHYLSYPLFKELISFGCKQGIIDFFIKGPGEKSLYQLIECINKKDKRSINKIPGLICYKQGKFIDNVINEFIFQIPDLNGLPLELYKSDFPRVLSIFSGIKNKKILIIPYQFMYGGKNKCIFCESSSSNCLKFLSPKEVVNNLKILSRKYNTKYFFFLSSEINISKKYINDLCDEIINQKLDILWTDCARFDNIDKKTLEKMRRAGCISLIYGLETGSPRMLKYIQKGFTIERASEVLKLTHETGIWTGIEIIAGLPHEKEEDIDLTIDFLEKNNLYINTVFINPYHITKGSLLNIHPKKYGIKNKRDIFESLKPNEISYNKLSQAFSFDEINGLKWDDKKKQITHSFQKIYYNQEHKTTFFYNGLPFLFLLYDRFKSKGLVEKRFRDFSVYLEFNDTKTILLYSIDRQIGRIGIKLKNKYPNFYKSLTIVFFKHLNFLKSKINKSIF